VPLSMTVNDPMPDFKGTRHYLSLNISEMVEDRDIVTTEYQ